MNKRHDWEAIERDYRTGKFSLRELGAKHAASYADIGRRAKRDGWTKDLAQAIKQATSAALIKEITTRAATDAQQATTTVVLAAAQINKQVILEHRTDIADARQLRLAMIEELRATTLHPDRLTALLAAVSDDMTDEGRKIAQKSLRDLMRLHERVGSMQRLEDCMLKEQTMARKAFGLDDESLPAGDEVMALSEAERASRLAAIFAKAKARVPTTNAAGE